MRLEYALPPIGSTKAVVHICYHQSQQSDMGCCITMKFSEKRIDIAMNLPNKLMQWHAELRTATRKQLPFTSIDAK